MSRSHLSWRTRLLLGLLVVQGLVTAAVVAGLLALLNSSGSLAADRGAKAVTLAGLTAQNRDEVTRLGGTPIGPDPGTVLRGDPGPAGQDGATGAAGQTGPAGRAGRDGRDATPAQVAAAVAAYMRAHPAKAGTVGRDGADGAAGESPPCMADIDRCQGLPGPSGSDGAAGANGQPPSAWRWTDPATGTAYVCTRDPSTPDSAPVYGCTADQ